MFLAACSIKMAGDLQKLYWMQVFISVLAIFTLSLLNFTKFYD